MTAVLEVGSPEHGCCHEVSVRRRVEGRDYGDLVAEFMERADAELYLAIRAALVEWRDARAAIFATPVDKNVTPEQFARLSVAETALMGLARKL